MPAVFQLVKRFYKKLTGATVLTNNCLYNCLFALELLIALICNLPNNALKHIPHVEHYL